MLSEVMVWDVSIPQQEAYCKVIGDWVTASMIKVYFEKHGYLVELEPYSHYNLITIKRPATGSGC
jgi:hypothetical protein